MTEAPVTLDLTQCQDLETAWDWTEWLMMAAKHMPEIQPEELHVIALWMSYQHACEYLSQWMAARELSLVDSEPLKFALQELEQAVFAAITNTEFEIESAAGLTIILSIVSTNLKLSGATIEEYREALASATITASALAYKEAGIEFDGDKPIPPTMH